VGSGNPARTGDSLQIYATGLGPLQVAVASGAPSPVTNTIALPTGFDRGKIRDGDLFGTGARFAGLYQVNVVCRQAYSAGNLAVLITTGGISSNVATLAVQP